MSLNMKNYKGFDKKPYCNAHCPTAKFTAVADTPEMNRLQQNTKNQSLLKYHADFEAAKGRYTSVADDPETRRHLENTSKISSIKYHEEFEKLKGTKIQVADDPETQRIRQHSQVISQVEYTKGLTHDKPNVAAPPTLQAQPIGRQPTYPQPDNQFSSPYSDKNQGHSVKYESNGTKDEQSQKRPGSINDYDPLNENWGSIGSGYRPNSGGRQEWNEVIPVPSQPNPPTQYQPPPQPAQPQVHQGPAIPINQPLALHVRHPDEDKPRQQSHQEPPRQPSYHEPPRQPAYQEPPRQPAYQEPPRQPAYQEPPRQPPYQEPPRQPVYKEPAPPQPEPTPKAPSNPMADAVYQAMYDYEAQDDDEVGFQDGDYIDNIEPIDEGWMFGTVRRSGMRGMLPSNYVERVQ